MSASSPVDEARYLDQMETIWQRLQTAQTAQQRRHAFIAALNAAREHDQSRGCVSAARVWHQLLTDVLDVDDDLHVPSLTPDRVHKGMPRWQCQLIGVALRAIDTLLEARQSEQEAIRRVLRLVRFQLLDIDEKRLRNWRQRARKTNPSLPAGAIRRWQAPLPDDVAARPAAEQAQWLLHQLEHAPALRRPPAE